MTYLKLRPRFLDHCALFTRSFSLLFLPASESRPLEQSVREKYADPREVAAHRAEAIAGPMALQRQFLERHLASGSNVLDVGCAAGRIALAASRMGNCVTGVDLCAAMVAEARDLARRQHLDARFCTMDARTLAFAEGSFDVVLMLGSVLSYIPGHDARLLALREAYRVLKPGGKLLLETQSRTSRAGYRAFFATMSYAQRGLQWFGHRSAWEVGDRLGLSVSAARSETPVYFHMYSPAELARDLDHAGYDPHPVETALYLIHYIGYKR